IVQIELPPIRRGANRVYRHTIHQRRQNVCCQYPPWNRGCEHGWLRGQRIERWQLKSREPAFVHLFVREFIKQNPDDPWPFGLRRSPIRSVVQRQLRVQRASLPSEPCELAENHNTAQCRKKKQRRSERYDLFKSLFICRPPKH